MAGKFFLIQNRQGKTRVMRYWEHYTESQRKEIRSDVYRLATVRDQKAHGNVVEYKDGTLVYRTYAGLYVAMCIEKGDNELFYLEAIHFFIEVLDTYFGSVCELDIVFKFNSVYAALDEVFLAGEIEETSKKAILGRLEEFERLSIS